MRFFGLVSASLSGNATNVHRRGYVSKWMLIPTGHGSCSTLLIMRAAIPIADGRISPVFDAARHLLLADIENGREVWRTEQTLEQPELGPRARRIAEFGADVLICGAISRPLEMMLLSAGVEVIPQTCGPVEDVLKAFISGRLTEQAFVMPGCCGRRRRSRVGRWAGNRNPHERR
ncbi:MAG: NifB/NifX family molybdenum-iron cluster-binding protein [Pirellulales bacterium]|nr:NifB/NifX family molybdenum-iron cluster-binding protein [Pirellulales bacterium]